MRGVVVGEQGCWWEIRCGICVNLVFLSPLQGYSIPRKFIASQGTNCVNVHTSEFSSVLGIW